MTMMGRLDYISLSFIVYTWNLYVLVISNITHTSKLELAIFFLPHFSKSPHEVQRSEIVSRISRHQLL